MILDQHELRVYSGNTELEALENAGTITVDGGWSPHVQARLTVRPPADIALTEPGTTITLELTQRFGDFALTRDLTALHGGQTTANLTTAYATGTSATLTALITAASWTTPTRAGSGRTFRLTVTSRNRTRDEHRLELASAEALYQDWVWYEVTPGREGVALQAVGSHPAELLSSILDAHQLQSTFTSPTIVDLSTPTEITPSVHEIAAGSETVGYALQFFTQRLKRIYSMGDANTLVIVDSPQSDAQEFTVAAGDNLIDWEIAEQRERPIMIRFEGTLVDAAARPIYSSWAFPELNVPHERFSDVTYPYNPPPGLFNGLDPAVGPYIDRIGLDESPVRLVTVNNYNMRVGSTISYTLPDEAEQTDTIDAITWQLGGRWEMDIWI